MRKSACLFLRCPVIDPSDTVEFFNLVLDLKLFQSDKVDLVAYLAK